MKDCPSCSAKCRDKDTVCGVCDFSFEEDAPFAPSKNTMFGIPGIELGAKPKVEEVDNSDVKQTLFGLPAQKIQDLIKEKAPPQQPVKKTMAGLNIAGLFSDEEENDAFPVGTPTTMEEESEEKENMNFGTMMGINVSDIMNYANNEKQKKSEPKVEERKPARTLFSLPSANPSTLEITKVGKAPDRPDTSQLKVSRSTASGGVPAATMNSPTESKKPAKVSLPSMLPKLSISKTDIKPIPKREAFETPVEFDGDFLKPEEETTKLKGKEISSGILKKAKAPKGERVSSGVVGAYVVGKSELSSDSLQVVEASDPKLDSFQLNPETDAVKEESLDEIFDAFSEVSLPFVDDPLATDGPIEVPALMQSEALEAQKEPMPAESSNAKIPEVVASKEKPSRSNEKLVKSIQIGFVLFGIFLVLATIGGYFLQGVSSIFLWISIAFALGISGATMAALFMKSEKIQLIIWSASAILLFLLGVTGAFLLTPLGILFVLAGLLFLISAIFPMIISKL